MHEFSIDIKGLQKVMRQQRRIGVVLGVLGTFMAANFVTRLDKAVKERVDESTNMRVKYGPENN